MKKIKIFSALDHLDTYELNRFEKYVKSPYFNTNLGIIAIVSEYQRNRKKGTEDHLDKEKLWSLSFGDKKYSDGRLRKLLSDTLRLFENFICLEHMNEKPLTKATMLVEALENRKLEELYNSSVRNAKRLTSEENEVSSKMHYHRYELEKVYYSLTDFDIKRNEQSNLSYIISNLDHFYLAEKIKYYCTSISRKSFSAQQMELLFIDEIKDHITKNDYEDVAIVKIWILIFRLQSQEDFSDGSNYEKFKFTFDEIVGSLPPKDALEIFGYGQNFCANAINKGNSQYFQELFELNKIALKSKILIQQDQLDPWLFRNIVTVALRLKEFEWTDSFIQNFGTYISDSFRANAVNYSKALLAFYQKNYDDVLTELSKMQILDLSYELNTRSLLILTFFEKEETDALNSLLDRFSVYLNRHKDISKARRENYQNMISFTRRLMNTLPSDKKAHEKMLSKLEKTKGIASGAWLKEKILERLN